MTFAAHPPLRFAPVIGALVMASAAHAQSPFATRILDYRPAPGQFVRNPQFNNPDRALCAPRGGGTINPDLSSLVSLGGFGGSITLAFDHPVLDEPITPTNPRGLDCIVFGNATYVAGNPNRRFAELATIEIAIDANTNGLADDPWYLVPGTHLPTGGPLARTTKSWDADTADPALPPASASWVPLWAPPPPQAFTTEAFALPQELGLVVLDNPGGLDATLESIRGYADHTPTLLLGDSNADNVVDDARITPSRFYTSPDDPFLVGISPGSAGGDAFDIAWAIDPSTGAPASLPHFDFIRITTAIDRLNGVVGEVSAEIDAVADVLNSGLPWPAFVSDFDRDCAVTPTDIFIYLDAWFAQSGMTGPALSADINADDTVDATDIFVFLDAWFTRA